MEQQNTLTGPSSKYGFERLNASDRPQILAHLFELDDDDRRMRFCSVLPDSGVIAYANKLDFERDLVLGYREIGKRGGPLLAMVHMGVLRETGATEFGISVSAPSRGRGLGLWLTQEAFRVAKAHGFDRVYVCYMDANRPMGAIVKHYPVPVHRDGGDNEVCIPLALAA